MAGIICLRSVRLCTYLCIELDIAGIGMSLLSVSIVDLSLGRKENEAFFSNFIVLLGYKLHHLILSP